MNEAKNPKNTQRSKEEEASYQQAYKEMMGRFDRFLQDRREAEEAHEAARRSADRWWWLKDLWHIFWPEVHQSSASDDYQAQKDEAEVKGAIHEKSTR